MLKSIPLTHKWVSYYQKLEEVPWPLGIETQKQKIKNLKKMQVLQKKCYDLWDQKLQNQNIATRNYALTHYQTMEKVPWPLMLQNDKFSKNL